MPFDPAHLLTTPRGINRDDPDVQRAFADAVRLLRSNRAAGSARRWAGITLPGCPAEQGCFNVIEASGPIGPPPRKTGPPPGQTGPQPSRIGTPVSAGRQRSGRKPPGIFGSSFVMAVELTSQGPRARTILTHSQSANPASPHYRDQTILFARKQWVTERFTEAEINADPHLQTTTLHG